MASINRRQFLHHSYRALGAAGLLATFPAFGQVTTLASSANDFKALVAVSLAGGNDGLNTVVPTNATEYAYYSSVRSAFALPQNQLLPISVPGQTRTWGLHPSLPKLHQLWQSQNMAIIANVGPLVAPLTRAEYASNPLLRPSGLFDHYAQILTWGRCDMDITSGWGNRMSAYLQSLNSGTTTPMLINIAENNPLLVGTNPAITLTPGTELTLRGTSGSAQATARNALLRDFLEHGAASSDAMLVRALAVQAQEALDNGQQITDTLKQAAALATPFPDTDLGKQLKQVARILSVRNLLGLDRRLIFSVKLSGFDTHAAQLATHAELLGEVDGALSAFYDATVELGIASNVVSFTVSDFGRRVRANAQDGCDHAWGNMALVVGGAVKGGAMYGRYPEIEIGGSDYIDDSSKGGGIWLPSLSLDQYGSTLAAWFGLDDAARRAVFPHLARFDSHDLGFL
jgi:uncharacterized protein (DUF1501 family)